MTRLPAKVICQSSYGKPRRRARRHSGIVFHRSGWVAHPASRCELLRRRRISRKCLCGIRVGINHGDTKTGGQRGSPLRGCPLVPLSLCLCGYFLPSDALISATVVSRSGFNECTDMIFSGVSFNRSILSENTIVPTTGGFGTEFGGTGRLNISA